MIAKMTSRERVLAAMNGKPYDRIPVISPVSLANQECMRLTRAAFPYSNMLPDKMAELAETSYTVLRFDSISPYFSIAAEASALGCPIDWGSENHMPLIKGNAFESLKDFRVPSGYMDAKSMVCVTDSIRMLRQRHGNDPAIFGKIIGPFTLLIFAVGFQEVFNYLVLDQQALRSALKEVKALCLEFALAQINAGADIITISEDGAGDPVSRGFYESVLMDIEAELNRDIHKVFAGTVFHLSCDVSRKADLFAATGFDALSFDSRNNLSELKSRSGNMKLIGNLNVPVTLLNSTSREVSKDVYTAIENGVDMIAPECSINLRVSNANLAAMRDAVIMYSNKHQK